MEKVKRGGGRKIEGEKDEVGRVRGKRGGGRKIEGEKDEVGKPEM